MRISKRNRRQERGDDSCRPGFKCPARQSAEGIRTNGVDASVILSDSTVGQESPVVPQANCTSVWLDGTCKKNPASLLPGIPKYTYRDLQKATCEFTTLIGQGAFGPVFKVKVLDTNSKQGEQEFQTEVADFGLSREAMVNHQKSNVKGTVGYLDPRYISSKIFTKKSDVYSFGVFASGIDCRQESTTRSYGLR
ncbi:hypothetical protein BHE74_00011874 [Ensete ventricosum]|nr:hypothetical protein BHE74_00011874 [Ensete ventricosum]